MMKFKLFCLLFAIVVVMQGCSTFAQQKTQTWKDMREKNVTMQKFDFSCGAGSLATLMNYYFQDSATEAQLIKDAFELMPEDTKNDRQENGLSLLDLKRLAKSRGYLAYGVKLKTASLFKMDRPFLVYMETDEFKHFTVFLGVEDGRVFLADSSRGNMRMPIDLFLEEWKGKMALALDKKGFKPSRKRKLATDENFFRAEVLAARNALFFNP